MMIESKILKFLNDNLIESHAERPRKEPENYCIIEKTGSGIENHLKESTVAIQSYATTLIGAAELDNEVCCLMLNSLINDDDIASIDLNGDYNFTDPESDRYRYQAVFRITHY